VADPAELLAAARLLCEAEPPPSDAQIRRAVSTAYYAVFHKIVRTAAGRFVGPGHENSAAFRLVYRGFEHARMKDVCEAINKREMGSAYQRLLGRRTVSVTMRQFAGIFYELQRERHLADYESAPAVTLSDAVDIIRQAQLAISAFEAAAPEEQADVLALMMVKTRS